MTEHVDLILEELSEIEKSKKPNPDIINKLISYFEWRDKKT